MDYPQIIHGYPCIIHGYPSGRGGVGRGGGECGPGRLGCPRLGWAGLGWAGLWALGSGHSACARSSIALASGGSETRAKLSWRRRAQKRALAAEAPGWSSASSRSSERADSSMPGCASGAACATRTRLKFKNSQPSRGESPFCRSPSPIWFNPAVILTHNTRHITPA